MQGGPTVLIKSRLATLFAAIMLWLSATILLFALNPRSRSALVVDKVPAVSINLLNLLELLLPSLAF